MNSRADAFIMSGRNSSTMGRLQDFDEDSVTCDNSRCVQHERVPSGQVPVGWLRGELDGMSGQSYDACGTNCAGLINRAVATETKLEYRMTWWSSKGQAVETFVGPNGWTIKKRTE